jgi:regulator of replication initiation timing
MIHAKSHLKTLLLTKKAFTNVKPKSKHQTETLAYAFEQIKPILKKYMNENQILQLEINLKNKHALALEPIDNAERQFFIESWLNNEISTKKLTEKLKQRFQWVEYLNFSDFLCSVESWLKSEN